MNRVQKSLCQFIAMSFPLFQADQTKEETLNSMTTNFSMTSALELNISINEKLILKKKPIKLHLRNILL